MLGMPRLGLARQSVGLGRHTWFGVMCALNLLDEIAAPFLERRAIFTKESSGWELFHKRNALQRGEALGKGEVFFRLNGDISVRRDHDAAVVGVAQIDRQIDGF